MKQTKLPARDSQAYNILSLTAVSGEFPADQIERLRGGCKYKIKILNVLKSKKYIAAYYSDKLRGYRLTATGKNALYEENKERFASFFSGNTETNCPKYEITRRLRMKSIAETFVTMQNAGVSVFKDEKLDVFRPGKTDPQVSVTSAAFYNSREMKEYGDDFIKSRGGRYVGVLLTELNFYVVYNTGSSLMKWENSSESKTAGVIRQILTRECFPHQYLINGDQKALMLGSTMEQAYQILLTANKSKKRYFKLYDCYDNFLYLPNNRDGELVLKLLCDAGKTKEFNMMISADLYDRNPGMAVENDAVDENGYPVLFAYDFDMHRIVQFNKAVKMYNKKGIIICFDFQKDVLERYCCGNITFQAIKTDKFERRFFP